MPTLGVDEARLRGCTDIGSAPEALYSYRSGVGHLSGLSPRNRARLDAKRSGCSTWGKCPQLGMCSREPLGKRVIASCAWEGGSTRSRSPHTTSVGVCRSAKIGRAHV